LSRGQGGNNKSQIPKTNFGFSILRGDWRVEGLKGMMFEKLIFHILSGDIPEG